MYLTDIHTGYQLDLLLVNLVMSGPMPVLNGLSLLSQMTSFMYVPKLKLVICEVSAFFHVLHCIKLDYILNNVIGTFMMQDRKTCNIIEEKELGILHSTRN